MVHAAWSALVLFATLIPATVVLSVPLRIGLAASAAGASLLAAIAVVPRMRMRLTSRVLTILAIMAVAATLVPRATAVLPPVPVIRSASGTGTAIHQRMLVGTTGTFAVGTERVYVWFAIAVPARYRQTVRFEWYLDDKPVGSAIETLVVGGRAEGFRTWSSRVAPAVGRWRVDLRTDSSQLIARESFVVR